MGTIRSFVVGFILLWAAAILAACASGSSGPEADALHDRYMTKVGGYNSLEERKAMAACINWDLSTKDELAVSHTQGYYQAKREGNIEWERGVTRSANLMKAAVSGCESTRKTNGADCKCQPMDRNGESALMVPDSFTQ
jgi:hypothetical protein